MKTFTKLALVGAILSASVTATPVVAEEGGSLSANVGFASEYYFRGILQNDASASAGIDYENGGFYVGAWTADVGDGLEVDVYGGYGIETESGIGISLGFTSYQYTDDDDGTNDDGPFDTEYNEFNLNLSYGIFSLEYSGGEHEVDGGDDEDYTFIALTLEHNGFYGTYGAFSDDWDGDYVELGYGAEIGGFDAGVSLIFASDDLGAKTNPAGDTDEAIVFSIGKTFDL